MGSAALPQRSSRQQRHATDPHLGASQLWVSRTLQHMEAAKAMSVDGALLITWRMEAVAPTIWCASLALASLPLIVPCKSEWSLCETGR